MSTSWYANINLSVQPIAATGLGSLGPLLQYIATLQQGTGDAQFDQAYAAEGTVASGTPVDLDLIGGGLKAVDGSAFGPVEICGMAIKNLNIAAAEILTVGQGSNPFISWLTGTTPALKVMPGGTFILMAPLATGYLVTAATADILRLAAASGTISYQIALLGRSA